MGAAVPLLRFFNSREAYFEKRYSGVFSANA
jgi:hypothetical protein